MVFTRTGGTGIGGFGDSGIHRSSVASDPATRDYLDHGSRTDRGVHTDRNYQEIDHRHRDRERRERDGERGYDRGDGDRGSGRDRYRSVSPKRERSPSRDRDREHLRRSRSRSRSPGDVSYRPRSSERDTPRGQHTERGSSTRPV